MRETIDAIYENGLLRPLKPVSWLSDKRKVKITILDENHAHPLEECIGILPDEDAREMKRIISEQFERVNPDEWK
jgi:predicted DNA-binding antitoxin AbrB/MazE fold protein